MKVDYLQGNKGKIAKRRKTNIKRYDIVTIRYCRNADMGCSRSCNLCLEYMRSLSMEGNIIIDRVYYIDENGDFGYEKLSKMRLSYFSKGTTPFSTMCC